MTEKDNQHEGTLPADPALDAVRDRWGSHAPPEHLSRISTLWTQVFQAHADDTAARQAAQSAIVQRYSGAVYCYLRKVLGDADAADEVFQQFALRFVQGGFRHADPSKGRFRDYLKTSLLRLVWRYRQGRSQGSLKPGERTAWETFHTAEQLTTAIDGTCREDLLSRAWNRLRQWEERTGWPYFTVLDYRARWPQATSRQMARELSERSDRELTPEGLRKTLQRARTKFADFLVQEVTASLGDPGPEELEEEMIELGLHVYCRSSPRRRSR